MKVWKHSVLRLAAVLLPVALGSIPLASAQEAEELPNTGI